MKYIIGLDLETTGLDPDYHETIQIGSVIIDEHFNELSAFEILIKPEYPHRGYSIQNGKFFSVYELNHLSPEMLQFRGVSLRDGLESFHRWISKTIPNDAKQKDTTLFGQNIKFDISFMKAGYKKLEWDYPFDYHSLDLASMWFMHHVRHKDTFPESLSQNKMGEALDIKNEKEHDALSDIRTSVKLMRRFCGVK